MIEEVAVVVAVVVWVVVGVVVRVVVGVVVTVVVRVVVTVVVRVVVGVERSHSANEPATVLLFGRYELMTWLSSSTAWRQ